jgi:hypothetical protein
MVYGWRARTVEAGRTASEDLSTGLDRIEAAVEAGTTDLRALGFWPLVARVKTDRILVEQHADRIARIDTAAFRRGVRLRVPVWAGNVVLSMGVALGVGGVAIAFGADTPWIKGVALILAGGTWTVAVHSPTHWLVGRAVGIGFTDYFLGGPPPPRPSLKIDYASYLRADPYSRSWMHASGAIATKLVPFVALAFGPASGAPWWSAVALVALGAASILTDVLFSVRLSDWKRFLRERRVARAMEPAPILARRPGSSGTDRAERPAGRDVPAPATRTT